MNKNREYILNEILKKSEIKDENMKLKIIKFFNKFNKIVDDIIKYDFNSNYTPIEKVYDLVELFEDILNSSSKDKKNALIALYQINSYFRALLLTHLNNFKKIIDETSKESEIKIKEEI
jgi:predicted DNA binding protein